MSATAENTVAVASSTGAPVVATQAVATTVAPAKKDGGFSATPTVGELVEFQLTGLLVVFVVLGSITAISGLMSWLLKVLAPNQYYGKSKP